MADSYTVQITSYAENAVREIGQYIAVNLQSPQNAISTLSAIQNEIAGLAVMPARIPLTSDEPWRTEGVHRMRVRNFYVYMYISGSTSQIKSYRSSTLCMLDGIRKHSFYRWSSNHQIIFIEPSEKSDGLFVERGESQWM